MFILSTYIDVFPLLHPNIQSFAGTSDDALPRRLLRAIRWRRRRAATVYSRLVRAVPLDRSLARRGKHVLYQLVHRDFGHRPLLQTIETWHLSQRRSSSSDVPGQLHAIDDGRDGFVFCYRRHIRTRLHRQRFGAYFRERSPNQDGYAQTTHR